ncbi:MULTISPECIES: DUF3710 domain-containing protein [unclassified Streptomyces]|uniref:DUF3710 domain-containing protein n=1 Tax=unclassified Streptomyces TaxID=2593676 RepID=UPI00382A3CB9
MPRNRCRSVGRERDGLGGDGSARSRWAEGAAQGRAEGGTQSSAVRHGGTASLQLQAFRTSGEPEWGTICDRLEADLRARGAEVERWSGRVGVELRAVVPVAGDARGRNRMTLRFVGCDGPGWLLRGVIGGAVALPDSRDDWACGCFEGVVVDPAFVVPRAVPARPAVGDLLAPPEQSRVIPLRFPE